MKAPYFAEKVTWCIEVATLLAAMRDDERCGTKLTQQEEEEQRELTAMLEEVTVGLRRALEHWNTDGEWLQ
jgi:hypothetical protein